VVVWLLGKERFANLSAECGTRESPQAAAYGGSLAQAYARVERRVLSCCTGGCAVSRVELSQVVVISLCFSVEG
jgi:hypothetical protein